ncbi:hypothetical protein D3C80_2016210 [compost metagenome]
MAVDRPSLCWTIAAVCGRPSASPFWVTTITASMAAGSSDGLAANRFFAASTQRSEVSWAASLRGKKVEPILPKMKS